MTEGELREKVEGILGGIDGYSEVRISQEVKPDRITTTYLLGKEGQ